MKPQERTGKADRSRRRVFRVQIALPTMDAVYSEIFVGLHAFAREHPEMLLLGVLSQADSIALAASQSLDGLVGAFYSESTIAALSASGVPAVNVSNRMSHVPLSRVITDDHAVGRMGVRHLLDCGFRCVAYAGFPGHAYSAEREAGFLAEAKAVGCPYHVFPAVPDVGTGVPESEALAAWMRPLPRPLGIMACNDVRAYHVLSACQQLRLRVPEDVAILGVDNDTVRCRIAAVALSSVAPNAQRVGWLAAELLLRRMQDPGAAIESVRVPPLGVVVRQSTDVVAAADPLVARAVAYIREHVDDPELAVTTVARSVGVSDRALFRRFQHSLGWSPYKEILRTRLNLARRLLFDTDLSIKKIASTCGFAEARELSVMYRRQFGTTATAFRRETRIG